MNPVIAWLVVVISGSTSTAVIDIRDLLCSNQFVADHGWHQTTTNTSVDRPYTGDGYSSRVPPRLGCANQTRAGAPTMVTSGPLSDG